MWCRKSVFVRATSSDKTINLAGKMGTGKGAVIATTTPTSTKHWRYGNFWTRPSKKIPLTSADLKKALSAAQAVPALVRAPPYKC